MTTCTTLTCGGTATVPGTWGWNTDASKRANYCRECATYLWFDGSFHPDNEADLHSAADFTPAELEKLGWVEAQPPAPESFDPVAAVRRVEAVCRLVGDGAGEPGDWGRGYDDACRQTVKLIRDAIRGDTA